MDITGHAAIVTGGASGLGAATAARWRRRRQGRLPRRQSRRRAQVADKIGGIAVAATSPTPTRRRRSRKRARQHGTPRILINCAGVGPAQTDRRRDGPMPLADFERVIEINLIGNFNMMRLAAADMQKVEPLADGSAASSSRPRRWRRLRARSGRRPMRPPRAASPPRDAGGARARPVRYPGQRDRARDVPHADAARGCPRRCRRASPPRSLSPSCSAGHQYAALVRHIIEKLTSTAR